MSPLGDSSPGGSTQGGSSLDHAEIARYGRHLILPQVGIAGQERLKGARVLVVGVGGLGSPAATYLAAAGVGVLGLIDDDRVELTNLQRQILYGEATLGQPKVTAARQRLGDINPHVEVRCHELRLEADNALELLADYDLVLDGSDNFATRYLVNDACVILGRPLVWGAVARFEGQVAVFHPPQGGCYRCLFPQPPPSGLVPSCAEGGVLGVLPGVIGSLQASEALKILLQVGEPSAGRLVIFDALRLRFREVRVAADPGCEMCGAAPEDRRLIPCEPQFCDLADGSAVQRTHHEESAVSESVSEAKVSEVNDVPLEISVAELRSWLEEGRDVHIIDVREPQEVAICRLPDSQLIPLRQIPTALDDLDKKALTVVHCHHGSRSMQAVMFMRQQGFARATNLEGGIDAWSLLVDASVARY